MADYTNNYKYVAEAWIENGKEEGLKTAFLNALFHQWQGHSDDPQHPKFDADTVDGMHYGDIEELVNTTLANTVAQFHIGYTNFTEEEEQTYHLGIESINLYPDQMHMEEAPAPFNDFSSFFSSVVFPWSNSLNDQIESVGENPNLYEIIKDLYNKLNESKADSSVATRVNEIEETLSDMSDALDSAHITEDGINASSVNGIRFYIVTPDEYEAIPVSSKKDIHNVYIIKEQEDIDEYYTSIGEPGTHSYDGNPNAAPWDRAYVFDVQVVPEYKGEENVTCLVYKVAGDDNWKPIAPARDFIDLTSVNEIIQNNLSNYVNITKENLEDALHTLTIPDDNAMIESFPITEYYNDQYISGAKIPSFKKTGENITETGNLQDVPIVVENGKKILNFSSYLDSLTTVLNQKFQSVASAASALTSRVTTAERNINQNQTDINALKGDGYNNTNSYTLTRAYNDTNILRQDVNTLEENTVKKGWQKGWIPGLVIRRNANGDTIDTSFFKDNKGNPNYWNKDVKYRSFYAWNDDLGLGYCYITFLHYHKAYDSNNKRIYWNEPQIRIKQNNCDRIVTYTEIFGNKSSHVLIPPYATVTRPNGFDLDFDAAVKIQPCEIGNSNSGKINIFINSTTDRWCYIVMHTMYALTSDAGINWMKNQFGVNGEIPDTIDTSQDYKKVTNCRFSNL